MIPLFKKLQDEKLLKDGGYLLDLGGGNGRLSEPFLRYGYKISLIDSNKDVLEEAKKNLGEIGNGKNFELINQEIENFKFLHKYDGVIMSNVLPFQKDKEMVSKIIESAFNSLNDKGFLFLTLFGTKDQWSKERTDRMTFYIKEEALLILNTQPYFMSEDFGKGLTKNGDIKTWHIFYLLYIKE